MKLLRKYKQKEESDFGQLECTTLWILSEKEIERVKIHGAISVKVIKGQEEPDEITVL